MFSLRTGFRYKKLSLSGLLDIRSGGQAYNGTRGAMDHFGTSLESQQYRDGGTYVEMGQFTDAGAVATNWHRICTKDVTIVGSWGFTGNDIPLGIALLDRAASRYPWELVQSVYPLTRDGIAQAVEDAGAMRTLKATICP